MANSTAVKLNTMENSGYSRRYYSMFKMTVNGRKLSRAELAVLGAILSYSNVKGNPDARCQMSYSSFEKQLRTSRATVASTITSAVEAGIISQDKSNPAHASYKYEEIPEDKGYIVTWNYLYITKFTVKGEPEPRYLTRSAIDVFSLIKTHCDNKREGGKFIGSVRSIMSTLNLSKRTVQKALDLLMRAKLIFRSNRGINGHARSEFHVNEDLLRDVSKRYRKEQRKQLQQSPSEKKPEWVQAADDRSDRERYYSRLQDEEQARVAHFKQRLDADKKYHALDLEVRKIGPTLARAEHEGNASKVDELQRKNKSLREQMARRMTALGISPDDLKPVYRCAHCNDTGFRKDGRACSCYPSPGRRQS